MYRCLGTELYELYISEIIKGLNAFTKIIENYSFWKNWCETEVIQKLCNNTCVDIKVQNILNVYNKTGR